MVARNEMVVRIPRDLLDDLRDKLARQGVQDCTIRISGDLDTIRATTEGGEVIRVSTYRGVGYQERTVSRCLPLAAAQRRKQARRMYGEGLTQEQIGDSLGCSQKTICNDVRGVRRGRRSPIA